MEKFSKIGQTGTYIQDYDFDWMIPEMPISVVLEWVKTKVPEIDLGNQIKAKALHLNKDDNRHYMLGNGWLNKLFVIVAVEYDYAYAITNWDGRFHLLRRKIS